MKKCFVAALFLSTCTTVYGQFNTITKIKNLPQIQIDTIKPEKKQENIFPSYEPVNSTEVIETTKELPSLVCMPLSKLVINSRYGSRIDPITGKVTFHEGIDFRGSADSVLAVMPGIVRKVAYARGLGKYIEVEHGDYRSIYGHLSFILVREKQHVTAGALLGITGTTGRSTGDHLHFAVKHRGKVVNPTPILDAIYRSLELKSRKKTADLGIN